MDPHALRSHALHLPAAAAMFALLLAGCGGGSSTSSGSTQEPTTAPAPLETSSSAGYSGGRHHRHHRHHGNNPESSSAANSASGAGAASGVPVASSGGSWTCNNQQFLTDQQQFASGSLQGDQEVDVCGTVTSVLPSKTTRSGLHGYYKLQVAPGNSIEIVSDLGEMNAPQWPWVKAGDYSYVQGRYYYDSESSQGIDWTHHGTGRSWPTAGYVVVGGTQYQ
jgi:uncharacterized Zn-binding protein involved in type VI secretion